MEPRHHLAPVHRTGVLSGEFGHVRQRIAAQHAPVLRVEQRVVLRRGMVAEATNPRKGRALHRPPLGQIHAERKAQFLRVLAPFDAQRHRRQSTGHGRGVCERQPILVAGDHRGKRGAVQGEIGKIFVAVRHCRAPGEVIYIRKVNRRQRIVIAHRPDNPQLPQTDRMSLRRQEVICIVAPCQRHRAPPRIQAQHQRLTTNLIHARHSIRKILAFTSLPSRSFLAGTCLFAKKLSVSLPGSMIYDTNSRGHRRLWPQWV
ncbi:MAG: hypothetical protein BWY76_02148 [bacterium ADurb.Bin429]|nr:MAG: hypothetical protein BWY76_02148 [bacterium ADurb.Bin429]